ncbi:MAG: tetraacyldisaccharide 4'-kinase [Alphaproteobacteria bacterium]|nr:tetraacyldisaccharide 4'-kinase [Alphaproteobacteria bacterium]
MLKNPQFWNHTFGISQALRPISWLYHQASTWREGRITPIKVEIPVICVGNIVMGGAGKTPTVMALVEILKSIGHAPHILSRGYGGYLKDTVLVDPAEHSYLQVGDEPLLLAQIAPTWIGSDRIASARAAKKAGATIIVMDDGLQNPSLFKDFSLIVIDAIQGFGNQLVFPAGPLREPIQKGLKRAHAVVVIGKGNPFKLTVKGQFGARLTCSGPQTLEPVVAFAGIGYPEKFRHSLEQNNYIVREFIAFADHHPYTITDIQRLLKIAEHHESKLITTSKDLLRIPFDYRSRVNILPIQLQFDNTEEIRNLLLERFPV